jgi:quinol monooxygenase YgiN
MVELTVVEPGCLQYELHANDADPMQFTFIETWASADALAGHDNSSHVRAIISDAPTLTSRPVIIQRLRRAGRNEEL